LIVRRVNPGEEFLEGVVLRIGCKERIDELAVERQLHEALRNLIKEDKDS
jgi:hypothetical protein